MVADGTGILGKCVKLVLTSGPHSSPPCCDLSLPSLRCSLHPQSFYPSLFPRVALHSSCDPVPRFPLLPYIRTQGERDVGLNGKTRGKGRATGALQAFPRAGRYPSKPQDPLSDCNKPNLDIYCSVFCLIFMCSFTYLSLSGGQRVVNERTLMRRAVYRLQVKHGRCIVGNAS